MPPQFASPPEIMSTSDHSFDIQLELTEPGVVRYAVYNAVVQVAVVEGALGVLHSNLDPSAAQVLQIKPDTFVGGLVGSGIINIPDKDVKVTSSITPPCVDSVCSYTAYGLPGKTGFR